jgi:hypothetical protein
VLVRVDVGQVLQVMRISLQSDLQHQPRRWSSLDESLYIRWLQCLSLTCLKHCSHRAAHSPKRTSQRWNTCMTTVQIFELYQLIFNCLFVQRIVHCLHDVNDAMNMWCPQKHKEASGKFLCLNYQYEDGWFLSSTHFLTILNPDFSLFNSKVQVLGGVWVQMWAAFSVSPIPTAQQ